MLSEFFAVPDFRLTVEILCNTGVLLNYLIKESQPVVRRETPLELERRKKARAKARNKYLLLICFWGRL
jgi:hypothetical protein